MLQIKHVMLMSSIKHILQLCRLHKCIENVPYKAACTVQYCIVFLTMNVICSKHVEDKKSWIKTLILKVHFCWLTLHTCIWLALYNCTTMHGTNSIKMHIACYSPLSITESTRAGIVCPDMLQGWLTPHQQDLPKRRNSNILPESKEAPHW